MRLGQECYGADTPDGNHCDHWHYEETGVGCCWCGRLLPDVDPVTRQIMPPVDGAAR